MPYCTRTRTATWKVWRRTLRLRRDRWTCRASSRRARALAAGSPATRLRAGKLRHRRHRRAARGPPVRPPPAMRPSAPSAAAPACRARARRAARGVAAGRQSRGHRRRAVLRAVGQRECRRCAQNVKGRGRRRGLNRLSVARTRQGGAMHAGEVNRGSRRGRRSAAGGGGAKRSHLENRCRTSFQVHASRAYSSPR
jgi:hypothetical protein